MWSSSRIAGALLALVFISLVVIPIVEAGMRSKILSISIEIAAY